MVAPTTEVWSYALGLKLLLQSVLSLPPGYACLLALLVSLSSLFRAFRNFWGLCRTHIGHEHPGVPQVVYVIFHVSSPPYHGSHAMLDIALSGRWGFPRPVAAPEQWITRSNVLGLYSFCFNVSKCPSLSCLTLYLQSLCCFKAGMERKENICYWSHSSISCLSTKSTWLKGADSSNLTFLSGLALPYTNCI